MASSENEVPHDGVPFDLAFLLPPGIDEDGLWRGIARLTYKQHGGSGTNLTKQDVLELEWKRFVWWLDWLEETRQLEADAIQKASKK